MIESNQQKVVIINKDKLDIVLNLNNIVEIFLKMQVKILILYKGRANHLDFKKLLLS